MSLGSKLLPMAIPLAKKTIAPLATRALSGLASLGVDKIFGKGQRGGFLVPTDKVAQLTFTDHRSEKGYSYGSPNLQGIGYQTNKNTAGWVSWYSTNEYRSPSITKCINRKEYPSR